MKPRDVWDSLSSTCLSEKHEKPLLKKKKQKHEKPKVPNDRYDLLPHAKLWLFFALPCGLWLSSKGIFMQQDSDWLRHYPKMGDKWLVETTVIVFY